MKKQWMAAYLSLTILICLLPFVGLLWKRSGESSENRILRTFPRLRTEEGWNKDFLSEAGAYFEEHFAYREEFVTADALLRSRIFGVSAENGVIRGTDGWLYYSDSLDDYLGSAPLSNRSIFNLAHTLRLMQEYAEKAGRTFLFAVAPNKNSLYGQHMPYYYQVKAGNTRNADRLAEALRAQNVACVDLYGMLRSEAGTLYHKRDSHWNNRGAALAAEALLDAAGKKHRTYEDAPYTVRADFEGDLDAMLFPCAVTPEEEIYYEEPFTYKYQGEVESNFDPDIETVQPEASGSLLMYRDSFGNALLPFLAQEFANAKFTRGIPYYLDDMFFCNADTVIVERAERFLPDMCENPPVFQSPEREVALLLAQDCAEDPGRTTCVMADEGLFMKFSGVIDGRYLKDNSEIYVCIDGETVYEAFPVDAMQDGVRTDCGYTAYVEKGRLADDQVTAELYTDMDGTLFRIYASGESMSIRE